jgi:ribosomal protein S18 acetylase RimI-like enzyme
MRQRGQRADMSGLYVTRRGQGIGSELSRRREEFARELGCERVRVSVWRSNERAKAFVQKQGFKRTGGGYRESLVGVRVDHYERDLLPA